MLTHRMTHHRSSSSPLAAISPAWTRHLLALCVAMAVWCSGGPAHAAPGDIGGKFQVNDADPVGSLPSLAERNANPVEFAHYLQDLISRAEGNFEKRKYADAARYYEALAKAVPDRALSFSRLCVSYGRLGKVELASANCGAAIRLQGAKVIDHVRFINFTLQKKQFTDLDAKEVDASLMQLRSHVAQNPQPSPAAPKAVAPPTPSAAPASPGSAEPTEATDKPARSKKDVTAEFIRKRMERMLRDENAKEIAAAASPTSAQGMHLPTQVEVLACKFATRLQDTERLGQCMQALRNLKVKEEVLLPFSWSQALIQGDMSRADALLEEARALKIPEATLQAMIAEQDKAFATKRKQRWVLVGLGAVFALGGIAVALRSLARRRKPVGPVEA